MTTVTAFIPATQTAKLVRTSLKEAFPDLKFSVKTSSSSSIYVEWEDGANESQVSAVVRCFAGAYFDGREDYEGSKVHHFEGKRTHFGAKYISYRRAFSDAAIQRAIDFIYRRYSHFFLSLSITKPTVAQYRSGSLMTINFFANSNDDLQRLIRQSMIKNSDRLGKIYSQTAAKVVFICQG